MDSYSHDSYTMAADSMDSSKVSGTNEIIIPLEYGFTKKVVQRRSGTSAGKYDVYIYSPQRQRFRALSKLKDYLSSNCPNIPPSAFENAFLVPKPTKIKLSKEPVLSLNRLTEEEIKEFSANCSLSSAANNHNKPIKNLKEGDNQGNARKHKDIKAIEKPKKRKVEGKTKGGDKKDVSAKRPKHHHPVDKKKKQPEYMSQDIYIRYLKKNIVSIFAQARYRYMNKKRSMSKVQHSSKHPKTDPKENGHHTLHKKKEDAKKTVHKPKMDKTSPKKHPHSSKAQVSSTSHHTKSPPSLSPSKKAPDIVYL